MNRSNIPTQSIEPVYLPEMSDIQKCDLSIRVLYFAPRHERPPRTIPISMFIVKQAAWMKPTPTVQTAG